MQRPFEWLSEQIDALAEQLTHSPVAPDQMCSAQVHSFLAEHFELDRQAPLEQVLDLTSRLLSGWPVHGGHSRNFADAAGSFHQVSLLGECLAHAWDSVPREGRVEPVVIEVENFCIDYLGGHIGFKTEQRHGFFTADERRANQTAVVAGLNQCFAEFGESGVRGVEGRPLVYLNEACVDRWLPVLIAAGLGRDSMRAVPREISGQLDVKSLRRMIIDDARQGHTPFLVVATAGTETGAVDPLKGLAALTRVQGMWLHVDACDGGIGLFGESMNEEFDGLRFADSIALDTRTAFAVAGAGGTFLCRHPQPLQAMQGVSTYTRPLTHCSHAWKVFVTLAHIGADGFADLVQHQCNMAEQLQSRLQQHGWRVQRPSSLPVLLVTDPGLNPESDQCEQYQLWVNAMRSTADTLLKVVRCADGGAAIRIQVANFATNPQIVEQLADNLEENRKL